MYKVNIFCNKFSSVKVFSGYLLPTEDAADQHCLQVYHQILEWLHNILSPLDFGWKIDAKFNTRVIPVQTLKPVAQEDKKY
jgi:hypothetical protein